jgi:hypothetical protein
VGEDNHCDVRQIGFLSDPETLGIAAESGIKRILVEFPPSYQKKFDRIADGRQDHLVEAENSVTRCNASTDKQQDAAYTALIKNAQEKHIKIRAGDANNNAWMKLVLRNALAMAIEGQLISTINKSAGEKWDALGFKWLFQVRSDETKVVQLVKDEGVPEETLIYRGNGHITSGAPHSLRSFFPDALALSFNSSLSAWDQMYLQVECRAGGALIGDDGYPVRASNYLLNLGSATVDKCYPNP